MTDPASIIGAAVEVIIIRKLLAHNIGDTGKPHQAKRLLEELVDATTHDRGEDDYLTLAVRSDLLPSRL